MDLSWRASSPPRSSWDRTLQYVTEFHSKSIHNHLIIRRYLSFLTHRTLTYQELINIGHYSSLPSASIRVCCPKSHIQNSLDDGMIKKLELRNIYVIINMNADTSCTYIHAYIHTYIHTCIYTYIHSYVHTYITYIDIHSCIRIYIHAYIYT
jgi:hypothetical protein